jgi:2-dehydro-3-deoxygluconokinase
MSTPHVAAMGELLLRLKAPGHERLMQSGTLEASFGGAEANVLAALAGYGVQTSFLTALPDNAIADAAIGELRRSGINTGSIVRREGRLGTYYLEAGAGHRSGRVIYDRAGSAFAQIDPAAFEWTALLSSATWLHVTGISPALSSTAARMCLDAVTAARTAGLTVSCDYNFRGNLWQYGKQPPEVMRDIVRQVHVGIAGRGDIQTMLGIVPSSPEPEGPVDTGWYRALAEQVMHEFPELSMQAITLRHGSSASHYQWSSCVQTREEFLVSQSYEIDEVVDRVGAGDAFSAGLVYGLSDKRDVRYALEFATAASCLKHTIPGDANRVSVSEVEALMQGHGGGRMRR